jgi:hypothetical protein
MLGNRAFKTSMMAGTVLAALLASPTEAHAKGNVRFGLGGGLGDPTGPSLKLFLHPQHALQFDLGWAPMHHGDGITHLNYLFHFKPFVEHEVLDFGLYLGAGIGMIFWAPARRGRYYDCYDPPGPDDYRCDYDRDYYYYRRHWYGRYRNDGGASLTARPPVGLFVHWKKIPLDTVVEGTWSPYIVPYFDPWHGDFSMKVRYYF